MIKVHRLGYVLLWIGIATLMGHSQEAAGDYVAPSQAGPKGTAPKMQVQLLSRGDQTTAICGHLLPGRRGVSPDCWSLRRSITLRVHISRLLEL